MQQQTLSTLAKWSDCTWQAMQDMSCWLLWSIQRFACFEVTSYEKEYKQQSLCKLYLGHAGAYIGLFENNS